MPSSRLTCLASPPVTSSPRFRRRVRVEGFFSRMWFMKAFRRRILPVPVILKRLAAPLSVFIFGIVITPLVLGLRRRRSGGAVGARLSPFGRRGGTVAGGRGRCIRVCVWYGCCVGHFG